MRSVPLRVALVARSLSTGGVERHLVKLCREVPRDRIELVLLLLVRDEAADLGDAACATGVPVSVTPFARSDPRTVPWLAARWHELGISVAHTFLWRSDVVGCAARLAAPGVRLICSERGDRTLPFHHSGRRIVDRLLVFRRADRFCTNSHHGARILIERGLPADRIEVIPNGVDLERIDAIAPLDLRAQLGWPAGVRLVGTVSRLEAYKGVDLAIRALARLPQDVHLVVIGEGPERGTLESLAASEGVSRRVSFLGRRADPEAYVKAFDVAVLTSQTEHCSNSILEAMACARPVVATDVGGNPELVDHRNSGLLVAYGDVAALAEALRSLLVEPSKAQQMGLRGRARVESEFQMREMARQFANLWQRAAS